MSFPLPISTTDSAEAGAVRLWEQIREQFREACLLHRAGYEMEAARIVQEELPPLIARWMKTEPQSPAACKRQLKEYFAEEQERVEHCWVLQRMFIERLSRSVLPALEEALAVRYRESFLQLEKELRESLSKERTTEVGPRPGERPKAVSTPDRLHIGQRRIPIAQISDMMDALLIESYRPMANRLVDLRSLADQLSRPAESLPKRSRHAFS